MSSQVAPGASSQIPNLRDRLPKLEPRKRRQPPQNPTPVPQTPSLPSPPESRPEWKYTVPTRRILSKQDHDTFLASSTCELVQAWIFTLAEAVIDTPCSAATHNSSRTITTLLDILTQVGSFVQKCPPDEQGGSRFGNKAFRSFLDLVDESVVSWHQELGIRDDAAIAETSTYLLQAFGDRDRIDYGSGHELNFMMWLLCLYQQGHLQRSDFKPLVCTVFLRYLVVMRSVQMSYYLEPAGSHGVWGLDDYQFLPFLFGAAQLLHHPYITPRAIHQDLTIEEFGDDFMYLGQVAFVNSTKTVKGLRWHSPMLDDISSAKSWSKIEDGMRRMFVAEILGKLPVMQHFLFGSFIPAEASMSKPLNDEDNGGGGDGHQNDNSMDEHGHSTKDGHTHDGTGWGDSCGIKVPSSIAAAQESRKMGANSSLRRIPFD